MERLKQEPDRLFVNAKQLAGNLPLDWDTVRNWDADVEYVRADLIARPEPEDSECEHDYEWQWDVAHTFEYVLCRKCGEYPTGTVLWNLQYDHDKELREK